MRTRRVGLATASLVAAGAVVAALQAGAAPPTYTTLDEAASQPVGIGDHGVAEKVKGNRPDVKPGQVFKNAAAARGGCLEEYGRGGECLPIVPPSQAEHVAAGHRQPAWDCTEVRLTFAKGISLVKKNVDPAKLDTNRDGTACGPGD